MSLLQEVSEILNQFFGSETITPRTDNCSLLVGSCGASVDSDAEAPPSSSS